MTTALDQRDVGADALMEVLANGNIGKLSGNQKLDYLAALCRSLDLNALTRPFQFIAFRDGKETLYATKDATDQLRNRRHISARIVGRDLLPTGIYVVTAQAVDPAGRLDESIGAVSVENLRGDALANALMKAETKAKRRVTLSICGLGILDETELETIPGARHVHIAEDGSGGAFSQRMASLPPPQRPAAPDPTKPQPAMSQWAAIEPATTSAADDAATERKRFWATATQLGYTTEKGTLSKRAVHRAFGVDERDGALEEYRRAEGLSWEALTAQLRQITERRREAAADELPLEPCPSCGETQWDDGACASCGHGAAGGDTE